MSFLKKKRTRVVLITAEAYPFNNVGAGPSSVRVLPESLARRGFDVSLITPKYRRPAIEALALTPVLRRFSVPLGEDRVAASAWKAEEAVAPAAPSVTAIDPEPPARRFRVYFIENVKYFGRERIFGSKNTPYPDNDERFTFFCRAALEFLRKAHFGADILHCHDWPTALVPILLRTQYPARHPFGRPVASVLTIHDSASRGDFPPEALALTGLPWDYFTPEGLALDGKFSFIKAGFLYADAVTAGDKTTASAVRTGEGWADLAAALERRKQKEAEKRTSGSISPDAGVSARLAFAAPETAGDVAEIYRLALQSRGGDIHVG